MLGDWKASVIDGPIQSAFVWGKGSGGGKKSRRSPQYPPRHSGHGEIGFEANVNMGFCYTDDGSSSKDKSDTIHKPQDARGHQHTEMA